ncbi:PRC and DUF2382 domain-containing protein [Actinoplanes sp. Pm04-4]|uniref:PRC and DUF2382 domain-containing protein n=1 Tax=Paractinoplanes pyxinae TaxID=2997416 RepID=A0ABT4AQL2_9ACTN|nr:PRC and DUF2382 domain-containing protein [Actinoplanes pyxinae]MCY1136544.1 PRC and DUF2382 domain-containing protein [Actinoplanes pyxinae]
MITQNDISRLDDADVYDTDGEKIGSVGQVYLDAESGDPEWVTVRTGLFGAKETFIPLRGADVTGDRVVVAYAKERVKDAPRVDADGPLSQAEEGELYSFYNLTSSGDDYRSDSYAEADGAQGRHATTSGDDAMTRSEEHLVAGTRTEQAGKARLRKYVVTEEQQVRVPVTREEVRLEREPITDANVGGAYDGPAMTESEHEVTLHAERPVVETETVPVERVRLGKETVRDEETISGEVRKEQIEFEGPEGRDRR